MFLRSASVVVYSVYVQIYVKTVFFPVEFTADLWYLDVVSSAKRTPIKTSNNVHLVLLIPECVYVGLYKGYLASCLLLHVHILSENLN
jgi:hypothetical protein